MGERVHGADVVQQLGRLLLRDLAWVCTLLAFATTTFFLWRTLDNQSQQISRQSIQVALPDLSFPSDWDSGVQVRGTNPIGVILSPVRTAVLGDRPEIKWKLTANNQGRVRISVLANDNGIAVQSIVVSGGTESVTFPNPIAPGSYEIELEVLGSDGNILAILPSPDQGDAVFRIVDSETAQKIAFDLARSSTINEHLTILAKNQLYDDLEWKLSNVETTHEEEKAAVQSIIHRLSITRNQPLDAK